MLPTLLLPTSLLSLSYLSLTTQAAPFTFANNPLGNNFPSPSPQQILDIQTQAHGSLPAGAPPATVQEDTLKSLRLVAFNEIFETAYFTSLLNNITTNATGYTFADPADRASKIAALTAVQAQEELHVLNANGALANFKTAPIQPCQYQFPVSTFTEAVGLAATFTDLVLGTLQDVTSLLGTAGDAGLIRGITSVIGQEGEQNGYYRSVQGKIPSSLPFLTASTRALAFSALNQAFVVPGSCDAANMASIDLPIFGALSIDTKDIKPMAQMLDFRIAVRSARGAIMADQTGLGYEWLSVVYINAQNKPEVQQMQNVRLTAENVQFQASFPYEAGTFGNGLTIAVLARSNGDLTSVEGVTAATIWGPGLIEIN
ncbi:hypothetical protein LZ554_008860 [Drepanopeziza brunnea f. sp. 'monogermtubi']|nr:hypothetical protein LZ554_008860 [Drepanopeziza brunnea f. sp. 'monogermtubi']